MNKSEVEHGHRRFVAANRARIEEAAIVGYQKIGRGLVIIDPLDDGGTWGAWYVPAKAGDFAVLEWFGLVPSTLEYDPAKELMVLFVEDRSRYLYRCGLSTATSTSKPSNPQG